MSFLLKGSASLSSGDGYGPKIQHSKKHSPLACDHVTDSLVGGIEGGKGVEVVYNRTEHQGRVLRRMSILFI